MSQFSTLKILYGSETGTAEDLSFWLRRVICFIHGVEATVSELNDYDPVSLPSETFVIFVVSTAGQGDAPKNMSLFWKFLLRKNLATDSLALLTFTVFGLGDSSYEKFNAAARHTLE